MDPLIVSWGYNSPKPSKSQYQDYLQFNGSAIVIITFETASEYKNVRFQISPTEKSFKWTGKSFTG